MQRNLRVALQKTNILAIGFFQFDCQNIGFLFFVDSGCGFMKHRQEFMHDINQINPRQKLNDTQRRQMEDEIKVHMEKYFKKKLGQGVDETRVVIWEDMLIIRGERFLTEPEIYIAETSAGRDVVREARMQVARQHAIDNLPYFEDMLQACVIHQVYDVEPENDYWIHVVLFNRTLTE